MGPGQGSVWTAQIFYGFISAPSPFSKWIGSHLSFHSDGYSFHPRRRRVERRMLPPTQSLCQPPSPPSSSLLLSSFSFSASVLRVSLCGSGGGRRHVLPSRTLSATCMANQRRVKMVAKQIRRELSDMLLTDKILQYAVLPEASLGADRYLSSLTTISDVEVSGDLQVVKVYVSVFGDERGKEVAIAGLKSKAKYVRSELGKRMKLRLTPEVRFIEDDSLERGSRVIAILDKLKDERENSGRQDAEQPRASELSEEVDDWDKDDPDEGIIYVN